MDTSINRNSILLDFVAGWSCMWNWNGWRSRYYPRVRWKKILLLLWGL